MTATDRSLAALNNLTLGRRIADYAQSLGIECARCDYRFVFDHLGAALADCVLQAGLNYQAVVRARVERIIISFPETATLAGTVELIERGTVGDFLLWKHSEKIERFVRLVRLLERHEINDTYSLRGWLYRDEYRECLLALPGIGPKTVDYLCCLVGMDCIAVDRHVKIFVKEAGVDVKGYDETKCVVSYAADLLDVPRREFDSWIWGHVSQRTAASVQRSVLSDCERVVAAA